MTCCAVVQPKVSRSYSARSVRHAFRNQLSFLPSSLAKGDPILLWREARHLAFDRLHTYSLPLVRMEKSSHEQQVGIVPVTVVTTRSPPSSAPDIRVDLRRGGTTAQIAWPLEEAASLGRCLRQLLG